MKSLKFLLGLVMVAAFALTACQPEVVTKTEIQTQIVEVEVAAKDTTVQIGYAAPALYGGQKMIEDAFAQAVNKMGWSIITTNANADPQKQNDDIDYMLSLGVDAIVTVPEDSAGICAAVEKANAAGVPFFTIDRSPAGCKIAMTVLSDNFLAGQQAGQKMVDMLTKVYGKPEGKVLEITGNLGQNVGQLRRDGFHDIVDKYPDIEVIQKVGDWDAAKGQQIAIDVLTANPDLRGIYMHSDNVYVPGTLAALEQVRGSVPLRGEKDHMIMTSVDCGPTALEGIWNGTHDGCGGQPVSDFPVVTAYIDKALKGEPIEEGEFVQEGAIWSPAKIKANADGTMELFLATVLVDESNISTDIPWTLMDKSGTKPEGTAYVSK
ncbi:MAG: sugar ABC transporter substrate-binding protein [Pelolinea sp.]|nr:sugar ABC transporter substrate-binding protein [Pelolinea sp.]